MKKLIALSVILCVIMTLLTACGEGNSIPNNPGNVYRVIVKDDTGKGVKGVMIQFCSDQMCLMGETDAKGIAVFDNQPEGTYTVHVFSVPEGYSEDPEEYVAPERYGDINIILKSK